MTKCTSKRCTRHFGIICTHHQWLTQLSCLSVEFSPDVIASYFRYCSRSTLAKAQLYQWVRRITGRRWLINVGDGNGLEHLTPASLAKGYAAVDVMNKASTCLTESSSALSSEPFQHIMACCGFTGTTQHTGNAARPWEYDELRHSMIALDSKTAGYDIVGQRISDGDYFDKECFCSTFTIDLESEPCLESDLLELTKERLWIRATCGPTSLPPDWTDGLKTTQSAYIPIEDWHWPSCVVDMPPEVIELPNICAADACEPDLSGYCDVKRAVDRACFCRNIKYESCGGSCRVFESRIDYVGWLYDLCGQVQDWHGLPNDWSRTLAVPTPVEMIPWPWTIKPSNNSDISYLTRVRRTSGERTCVSNEWKLRSFYTLNIAIALAAFLIQRGLPRFTGDCRQQWYSYLCYSHTWLVKGMLIAGSQLLANWYNVLLVEMTPGYENVPTIHLLLLWCSIPRPAWMVVLLLGLQEPFGTTRLSAAASVVLAEIIMQFISSYYMLMTIKYGLYHDFYLGRLHEIRRGTLAETMYTGALMWGVVVGLTVFQVMRAMHNRGMVIAALDTLIFDRPSIWQTRAKQTQTTPSLAERLRMTISPCICAQIEGSTQGLEERLLGDHMGRDDSGGRYGTFSVQGEQQARTSPRTKMYAAIVIIMLLLWIAQWLFWGGYIGLSSEE
ncbi:hypothetical protein BO82DRAFT_359881 [Aspergillus uvarum CBS 121591]|uniref:Uncharacterized protein n=1 Tax=Aspergillus uvarum CBS 121591 TaxID=1448315 RepID=A0A319BSG2_9EURO|nr:hypothetical protein BO82DRAFT_359881 [Aspergillus uvarum CBS 121591]PYH75615.1 hypothetical protein BO82DRAFT_359881 [Aspergillus uvarum CBS 121591]